MTNLMVIDVNATTVYRIKKLLENVPVEIHSASTIFEAINRASSLQDELDMIIIDINLGSEDGFELISKLQEMMPNLVTVIMTSINTRKSFIKAIRVGVIDYILKPFEEDYLKNKLLVHLQSIEYSKSLPTAIHNQIDASIYTSVKKAIREDYELLIGLLLVYNKKNPTPSSTNIRDIALIKGIFREIEEDLNPEDEIIHYGSNGFILVLHRKSLHAKPMTIEYYTEFCKHFFAERFVDDFAFELEFINLPHEIDPRQNALELLTRKIEKRL